MRIKTMNANDSARENQPTLRQRAEQRVRAGAGLLRAGWCTDSGEWTCAQCGTMLGKNLHGDSPFALARQHVEDGCPEDRIEALNR